VSPRHLQKLNDKENQSKAANNITTRNAIKDGAKTTKTTTKEKTKMTAREARRLIVAEIERLTVRAMIEHVTKPHVVEAVAALKIDHKGNCSTSRSVAAKRLFEHISTSTGGVGLITYLVRPSSSSSHHIIVFFFFSVSLSS
jgi:hypothetical protein